MSLPISLSTWYVLPFEITVENGGISGIGGIARTILEALVVFQSDAT